MEADLFEISAPEIGKVVSGRKTQNICSETKIVRKQLGCEKKNATVEPDSFLEKVDKKFVGLAKTFLKI